MTGKALACEIQFFPSTDSVVRVKGQILDSDKGMSLWIREMAPEECVGTDICALDLATPNWVVDQSVVDSFSQIWSTLANPYRELINAVLSEPDVMHGFLRAPGSVRHHDAMTGGCIAHTIRVAKMAICFAEITPALDRDMLVAGAILHDVGKSFEYTKNGYGGWKMSHLGKRVGHKLGGAMILSAAAKRCLLISSEQLEDLQHILTCSFAPAWAGYRFPATQEALALSAIDRLCSGGGGDVVH